MRYRTWIAVALSSSLGVALTISAAEADDREEAERVMVSVSSGDAGKSEMLDKAKASLERSRRLRAAGDEAHATLSDRVARAWAEAARDRIRAIQAEEEAARLRSALVDASARSERERALLEENIARAGRLRAQLEALDASAMPMAIPPRKKDGG